MTLVVAFLILPVLARGAARVEGLHGLEVPGEGAGVDQGIGGGGVEPGDVLEEAGGLEAC